MDWLFNQPQLFHGQNIIAAPKISLSIFPKLLFNFVQFEKKNTHRFLAISSLNGLPITWVLQNNNINTIVNNLQIFDRISDESQYVCHLNHFYPIYIECSDSDIFSFFVCFQTVSHSSHCEFFLFLFLYLLNYTMCDVFNTHLLSEIIQWLNFYAQSYYMFYFQRIIFRFGRSVSALFVLFCMLHRIFGLFSLFVQIFS